MKTKKCKACGEEKDLKEFRKCGTGKYKGKYIESYCKPCSTKKCGEWAKKNPEKNRAKALKYLHANKERINLERNKRNKLKKK